MDGDGARRRLSCKLCSSMKTKLKLTNVWAFDGTPSMQMSSITRHNESSEHKHVCLNLEKERVGSQVISDDENEVDETEIVHVNQQDRMIFNTVYFAAKSELPSETVNGLLDLERLNGHNVDYKNLSWDTITDMQESISHTLTKKLLDEIHESNVFALMLDESTDVTVEKHLSVCVRYVKLGQPQTHLLCNLPLEDGRAYTVVNAVVQECDKLGIDMSKCTSLATDGAAVMVGKKSGVGVQLQSKYSPYLIQTHCLAHRLNLACTDSIKKNEYLIKFRDKFNALYHFISASSVRTLTLKKIQELLQEPDISIKEPYSIRWLGLRNAVSAVFDSYGSVLATLSKFAADKNAVAKGLFKYFCSYKVALVVAFVLDVHNELAILSSALQKKNLMFSEVGPLIEGTIAKLVTLETDDGKCLTDMKAKVENRADDGMYFGEEKLSYHGRMDAEFETVRKEYVKNIRKNMKDRLKKRDGEILDDFSRIFEPLVVNVSSQEECDQAVERLSAFYGYEKSIKVVHGNLTDGTEDELKVVPPLVDPDSLKDECVRLNGMTRGTYANLSTLKLCKRVITVHFDVLPNCAKLAAIALCMQLTSVECERSFSTQNRLKNKFRASLKPEKLNTLIMICMLGPPLCNFDATESVSHWLKKKKRRKRRLFSEYKPRAKKQKLC